MRSADLGGERPADTRVSQSDEQRSGARLNREAETRSL